MLLQFCGLIYQVIKNNLKLGNHNLRYYIITSLNHNVEAVCEKQPTGAANQIHLIN